MQDFSGKGGLAMNKNLNFGILENADMEIIEKIAEFSVSDDSAKERIFRISERRYNEKTDNQYELSVSGTDVCKKRGISKIIRSITAIAASVVLISGTVILCSKINKPKNNVEDTVTINPAELEELPRGEYKGSAVDYLSGIEIENITDISPLGNNRFLVVTESDREYYGDTESQRLYVADDEKGTVTEITPKLNLGETSYYSVTGTSEGRIFITAIEPEYRHGINPGHAVEENNDWDRIEFLFSNVKNVNYKLFEINTKGEVISENKLDIEYNPDSPVHRLLCEDYQNDKLVITAVSQQNYFDKDVSYYIVNENGDIMGELKNDSIEEEMENGDFLPYADVKSFSSDGRFCTVFYGWDSDSKSGEKILAYESEKSESYETFILNNQDFGNDKRGIGITAGTYGHGDDLLYLTSGNGLFAFDKDGNYENIINYNNYEELIPNYTDIISVTVLDNNNVIILADGNFKGKHRAVFKFECADTDN